VSVHWQQHSELSANRAGVTKDIANKSSLAAWPDFLADASLNRHYCHYTHRTPYRPRTPDPSPLHSSPWQGTSLPQFWTLSRGHCTPATTHLRTPGCPHLILTAHSWVFRENRVPYYQREFQKHDGLRTWEKVRSAEKEPGPRLPSHMGGTQLAIGTLWAWRYKRWLTALSRPAASG
jgi:hypothetical protein